MVKLKLTDEQVLSLLNIEIDSKGYWRHPDVPPEHRLVDRLYVYDQSYYIDFEQDIDATAFILKYG